MKSLRCLLLAAGFSLAVASVERAAAAQIEIAHGAQPQLATGSDGRIWLVYAQPIAATIASTEGHAHGAASKAKKHKGGHGPGGRGGEVFVASSKDGGVTFSAPVKVAHVPQLMLGNRRGPRVAADGDTITVTAIADELIAFTSRDGGRTWSGRVAINDAPGSAREGLHDLAGAADGRLFVTWLDLRNGAMELWGAESTDGGATWSKNEQIYKSPGKSICECCHPNARFDAEGNLAVMWRNSIDGARDMWIATRARDSDRFGAARKLGAGTWKLNACPMDGGAIVVFGDGKFGAVWQRSGDVFFLGEAGASEINLGKGRQPVAVLNPEMPVVIWSEGANLVVVSGTSGGPPVGRIAGARFPSVVGVPGGRGVVVAYERSAQSTTSIGIELL